MEVEGSDQDLNTSVNEPDQSSVVANREQPAARLTVNKLVLKDFKSYAGVVSIGPFHKSFSAIVGPNGSGKSNIIDSLLFVFGFRAKRLRQEKLSQLIHKSSGDNPARSCYVEVYFESIIDTADSNGGQDYEVIPNSQIIVKRAVEKPSERGPERSQYFINGRSTTYSEVATRLKEWGIDLEYKRFLILQGEVESISLMKPKSPNGHEDGLLEYIEDIVGTSHYNKEIEVARDLLEDIDTRRDQMVVKLRLAENERDSLEKKSKKAFEYIQICNNLTIKKHQLYSIAILDCDENMSECKQKMTSETAALLDITKKKETLQSSIESHDSQLSDNQKNLKVLEHDLSKVKQELQRYEHKEIELKEALNHLNKKRVRLQEDIKHDKDSLESSISWLNDYEKNKKDISTFINTLSTKLEIQNKVLDKETEKYKVNTKHIQNDIENLQENLSPWLEKMDALVAEREITVSRIKEMNERYNSSQDQALKSKLDLERMSKELDSKLAETTKTTNLAAEFKEAIEHLDSEAAKLQSRRNELSTLVESHGAQLSEALSTQRKVQSRGLLYSALENQASSGKITGICGRLGDLGTIDDIYNTAVTTACSALDNVVVESVKTAQDCIEFLRKENLGRVTFICLDKLRSPDTRFVKPPEDIPRLFDLITPKEPKYANAFYQALGETLVCNDLDQAMKIAYGKKRYRVVTLQGQLLDISGIMSGCGAPRKDGMRLKSNTIRKETNFDIERTQEELSIYKQELLSTNTQLGKVYDDLRSKKSQYSNLNVSISKSNMEISALKNEIDSTNLYIVELTSGARAPKDTDIQCIDRLSKKGADIDKKIEDLKTVINEYQGQILILRDKACEIGGGQMAEERKLYEEIKSRLNEADASLYKLQAEHKSKEIQINKLEKNIDIHTKELSDTGSMIKSISGEFSEIQPHLNNLKKQSHVLSNSFKECQLVVNNLKSSISKEHEQMQELTRLEIKRRRSLDNARDSFLVYERRREHYEKEVSLLELMPISQGEKAPKLPTYTTEHIAEMNSEQIQAQICTLEELSKKDIPNLNVLIEYDHKCKLYQARAQQLEEVNKERSEKVQEYDLLRSERLEKFMDGFTVITKYLKEIYQLITLGGNAELEPVDSLDPFSEGIVFSVMPPKKSWKNICNLSGGEKTLSSLALVFALHRYKPTPLYFMDEVDAALDFRNVSIIASYIKERTKNAQFIVVSLRNNMFELSNRLVGVYKYNNKAKSVVFDHTVCMSGMGKGDPEVISMKT